MRHTREAVSNEFDRVLSQMTTTMTPQIATGLHQVVQNSTRELNRDSVRELQNILNRNLLERFADNRGVLDGEGLQAAMARVKQITRDYADSSNPQQKAIGRALREARGVIEAERNAQNPVQAADLAGADRAYAKSKILEIAHGKNAGQAFDGQFTPAQLGQAMGEVSSKYQKAGGQALFQDLVGAGKQVIPNTLPNSGTSERRLIHEVVLGLGGAHVAGALPHMAAGMAGTAAVYNPFVQRLLRAAIMGAPETRGPLGDFVRRYGPRVATPLIVDALKRSAQASAENE